MNNFNLDLEHVQKHVLTATRLLNSFYREHLDEFADKNSDLRSLLLNARPSIMGACATYFMDDAFNSSLDCRIEALHLVLQSDALELFDSLILKNPYVQTQYDSKMTDLEEKLDKAQQQYQDKQSKKRWYHLKGDMDHVWDQLELKIQTDPLEKALRSKKLSLNEEGFDNFVYEITSQLCSMAQQSCSLVEQVSFEFAAKNSNLTVTVAGYVPSGDLKRTVEHRRSAEAEYQLPRSLNSKS